MREEIDIKFKELMGEEEPKEQKKFVKKVKTGIAAKLGLMIKDSQGPDDNNESVEVQMKNLHQQFKDVLKAQVRLKQSIKK
jgi:hypothetical protein